MKSATKVCKYCRSEIDKKAKICPVCRKRQKKPGARIFALLLLIFGACLYFGSMNSAVKDGLGNQISSKSVISNPVNLENFNKIETGMTYEQVCEIFGKEGTVLSELDLGSDAFKTTMYYWYDITGVANCNVTVQGGKVIAKAQVGLK